MAATARRSDGWESIGGQLICRGSGFVQRATLRMFKDRGDVRGFFPDEGDQEAQTRVLKETPNLDAYAASATSGSFWPMVKDSLGNALRVDPSRGGDGRGHRAISDLAFKTLYGFNPCFVLELTATPKDVAATRRQSTPKPGRYGERAGRGHGAGAGPGGHDQDASQPRPAAGQRLEARP
jgi:type III restriction enzyme